MKGKKLADYVRYTYKEIVGNVGHEKACQTIAKVLSKNDPDKRDETFWFKFLDDYFAKQFVNQTRAGKAGKKP